MPAKKKVIGVGSCKYPKGRGKPSKEFTIDGVGYYFCYGWTDDWGEGISPICEECPAHINAADDVLHKLKAGKAQEVLDEPSDR